MESATLDALGTGHCARADAVTLPHQWRRGPGPLLRLFWYDDKPNFGDRLNPWLARRLGFWPRRASLVQADVIAVGSVLDGLPSSSTSRIWGAGLMTADGAPPSIPAGRILAGRGKSTRDLLGACGSVARGDPGLLVGHFASRLPQRYSVGLVPHLSHRGGATFRTFANSVPGSVLVDVTASPKKVIRTLSQCGCVVTSSLHGLVVADSLGIPATWVMPDPVILGGDFWFRDCLSVFLEQRAKRSDIDDLSLGRLNLGTVSASLVQSIQVGLLAQVPKFTSTRA